MTLAFMPPEAPALLQRTPVATGRDFDTWHPELRLAQVRYVALLTAALYFIYAALEWRQSGFDALSEQQVLRGLAVCLLLIVVALMSFRPSLHGLMRMLLLIAPAAAIAGNLYLSITDKNFASYSPEIYLAIMWTFAVSGLTLRPATVSALISAAMVLVFTALYSNTQAMPYLHLLWLTSAFAFGLLAAYLLERSYRKLFAQQRELERLATVDDLTGLWNQRHIRERLAREVDRTERSGSPLSVIMFDIDHFKRINDEHGHVAGDALLTELGELLHDRVRSTDIVGRTGGEEFLVVLPDTDLAQAEGVAEKLRCAIREHCFELGGQQTATFGLARYRPGETLVELIQRTDQAMYSGKRAGRDQVVIA